MSARKIVFDLGGVIFDWQPTRLLQRALPQLAIDEASAAHWAGQVFQDFGGDWAEFDRGSLSVAQVVQRIAQRTGLAPRDVQSVVDGVPAELQARPASIDLLRRLRRAGHELHYLSNMPAPFADLLEARNDFFAWFKSGVFSGRVQHIKPEPAIFDLAAQRFGAAPQALLFIDDHAPNVQAAQALGWQAFVFSSAAQAEAELRERGCLAAA